MSVLRGKRSRTIFVTLVALAMLVVVPIAAQSAVDRFTDVDDTNIFYDDIEWLAAAGITLGCTADGTQFCPDDFTARQEMAAFFHRYHEWQLTQPGGASDGVATSAAIAYDSPTATEDGTLGPFLVTTKSVTAPADGGGIIVTATASATPNDSGNSKDVSGRVWVEIGGDGTCTGQIDSHTAWFAYNSDDVNRHGTRDMTALGASGVSAGAVRVDVCTDALTKTDGSWNLTGNTVIQWAPGWTS